MARETCHYWDEQLAKYWDSGFTIQEYSELKELPYENVRRWIRLLKQKREGKQDKDISLEIVELLKSSADKCGSTSWGKIDDRRNSQPQNL